MEVRMRHVVGRRLVRSPLGSLGPLPHLVAGILVLVAISGCAGGPSPATPDPPGGESDGEAMASPESGQAPTQSTSSPGSDAEAAGADGAELEGGDQEWLVDDRGNRYRELRMPKVENLYRVTDDGSYVYLPPGLRYELIKEEEDTFVVKQYDPVQAEARRREALESRPEAEQEVLEADVAVSDRLRLAPFDRGLPNHGQWRQGFEIIDVDGDGHLDIVHPPVRKGGTTPLIYLGDSRGNWREWRELSYEGPPLDYGDVAVADFDGDGHLDLAFAIHLRGILVARGDGEGGFTHWETEGLEYRVAGGGGEPPSYSSRTVLAVDWDRDGRPDLLTLSEGPRMQRDRTQVRLDDSNWGVGLYLNRGEGRRVRQSGKALSNPPFGDDLVLGDFDGDGRQDFAAAVHSMGAKGILHLRGDDGGFEQTRLEALPQGMVTAVAAADFDGNGRDDLAVGMAAQSADVAAPLSVVAVLLAQEDGSWERRILAAEEKRIGVWAVAAGDLDGDDHADLLALTGDGGRWLFLGEGGGRFRREESPELAPDEAGCRGYEARLVDLDGDGSDEAILAFAGEQGSQTQFVPLPGAEKVCPSGGSLEVWTRARPESVE